MPLNSRIYLDHAASTPMLPAARAAMAEACDILGNPSSPHADGRRAKAALEDARARIAAALGWTSTIIFTSGATEAIDLVFRQATPGHRIVGAGEHQAVLRAAPNAARSPLTPEGVIDLTALEAALKGTDRPLVAIQCVNNETGVIQPLAEVATLVANAGGLLLADCAQSAGKLPLPQADFITLSAHKFGGPPGVGALLVRDPATLHAVGGQEGGYRPGTPGLPAILAMAAALEAHGNEYPGEGRGPGHSGVIPRATWLDSATHFRADLEPAILAAGGEIIAPETPRLPNIGAYRLPGVSAAAQLAHLDLAGISASAGPACSSGALGESHVLRAMGTTAEAAREVIRVSFGPQTTTADVHAFLAAWTRLATRAQAA